VVGQRKLIGVMMAQGIDGAAIIAHYLFLCITVAGIGGLVGLLVGQPLGVMCTRYYADSLGLPLVVTAFYPHLAVIGMAAILTTATLTGWGATRRLLGLEPAEVLRVDFRPTSRVPRLERVFPILARASYTFRLPLRNVLRHPLRNLGVICSLAFSVSILLMTLTFYDSERNTLEFFFTQVHHYDLQVDLVQPTSPSSLPPFGLWPGVQRAEFFLRQALKLRSGQGREIERGVWGVPANSQLVRIYDAQRHRVAVDDNNALLIGPLPMKSLGALPGSTVRLWADTPQLHGHETTLVVGPELLEPVSNPPKVTLSRLQEIMSENTQYPRDGVNIVLMQVDKQHQDHVRNALLASPYVAEVTDFGQFKEDIRTLLRLANAYFGLMAVFSGLLAFALLVASSTMTVADRATEIATLAVLGFSQGTLAGMLVVETLILWFGAMVVGVPGGYLLGNWLLNHYQADLIQMELSLSPWTIAATTLGSLVLCLLATVQSLGAVLKIPLSDSTRSAS
jgi:putative ABC transport system permease protein